MLCRVQPGGSGFQSPGPLTGKAVAISLQPRGEVAEGPVESPEDFIPVELDVWLCLLRNRLFPAISKQTAIEACQCELVSRKGTQEGDYLPPSSCQSATTPYSKP